MAKPPPPAAVLDAGAFHGMLTDLERTAHRDSFLPMLHGVVLHTEEPAATDTNRLYGTSTNRFLLGQAWEPCTGCLPAAFIDLGSVALLRGVLKAAGRNTEVTLTLDGDRLQLTVPFVGQLAVDTAPYAFPDLGKVIDSYHTDESSGFARLAAPLVSHLAQIGKRRNAEITFTFGRERAASVIDIGPGYRAILMPLNSGSADGEFRYCLPPGGKR